MTPLSRWLPATLLILLVGAACSVPAPIPSLDTTPAPVDTELGPDATLPLSTNVRHPEAASVIQVCAEGGPADPVTGEQPASAVVRALANDLEAGIHVDESWNHGLFVEVWDASSAGDGGGLLYEGEIGEAEAITVPAGLPADEQSDLLTRQDEERQRLPLLRDAASNMITDLRSTEVAPSGAADLLGCLSRANERMTNRDPARRLLVLVSSLPVPATTTPVFGDLGATRQVLLLGWGADFGEHRLAWAPTFASMGADRNLFVYDLRDGVGSVLADAVRGVLG
jgi:hypothetical protein